jgi:hypothetical protein
MLYTDWRILFYSFYSSLSKNSDGKYYISSNEVSKAEFLDALKSYYPDDFEFFLWNPDILNGSYEAQ